MDDDVIARAEAIVGPMAEDADQFDRLDDRLKGVVGLLTAAYKLSRLSDSGDYDRDMVLISCRMIGVSTEELLQANEVIHEIRDRHKPDG
jgi:hypothetical protein